MTCRGFGSFFSCLLVAMLLSGYAQARLVDTRESDGQGSSMPAGQDIESVDVSTSGVQSGQPPSTTDVNIQITVCVAACPTGNNQSIKVRIGGATVTLAIGATGSWTYTVTPRNGNPGLPWTLPGWDSQNYTVYSPGGTADTKSRCCATITLSANSLNLPVPQGKLDFDVSTHSTADGSGAAVDSGGPSRVEYSH